jgi:hypothetical protein
VNALALEGDEGREKLRKAAVRSTYPLTYKLQSICKCKQVKIILLVDRLLLVDEFYGQATKGMR